MARKTPSDRRLKRFSEEHVLYEIGMLRETAARLQQPPSDVVVRNALIETFGIHLRLVVDFLYEPAREPDDVCAEDYVADVNKWKKARRALARPLKIATRRTDKQIAHLTFKRYRGSAPQKRWNPRSLLDLTRQPLKVFREHALNRRLHRRVRDYIDGL